MELEVINQSQMNLNEEQKDTMNQIMNKAFDHIDKGFLKNHSGEVSLTIVDEDQIKQLNHQYRGKPKVTDVLSFPQLTNHELKEQLLRQNEYIVLGDILICDTVVTEQASEYGHSELREMSFLFLHGLLHLLGYDHEQLTGNDEQTDMFELQENILTDLGITRT